MSSIEAGWGSGAQWIPYDFVNILEGRFDAGLLQTKNSGNESNPGPDFRFGTILEVKC